MSRRLLDDVLRFHGYDISQTGDPLHAFAMLQEHIPDLIIMDIQLPHISGLELTRWIKEDIRLSGIPIVAVTAFAMEGDKQKILAGGCDAYIAKPFNVEDFLHIIAEFIG
ncbi:MAG: response regulator [Alphaproteobacteria bacterium]|nr:response regulator [Alphaproteobacteria bacterium]MBV9862470.1 response regulator [Alphaproteobacteria bacterium]